MRTPRAVGCAARLVTGNFDDFRRDRSIRAEVEVADGYLEVKAARAAGARIEIEHALVPPDRCLVGVAVQDDREFRRRRVEVKRLEIVQQIEVSALNETDFGFRKTAAPFFAIDVAADGGDRGNLLQCLEDIDVSHIAEMKNTLYAG